MSETKVAEMETVAGSELWRKVLEHLRQDVDPDSLTTWFLPLRCQSFDKQKLTLVAPNDYYRVWILSNYREELNRALRQILDAEVHLEFVTQPATATDRLAEPTPTMGLLPADGVAVTAMPTSAPSFLRPSRLNPKYTFEQYVVGENNRFAHAACRQVADPSSKAFNPLFLYGGTGLGKTHLLHAIGHQILKVSPHLHVRYVTSEEFMNHFIEAISLGQQAEFREYYRKSDLLMIDDVQFFSGKERTQVEFFHTFNALYNEGKKIVISSDRPPHELHELAERLRNRFAWGLVVDIQPPDLETRIAILKKKASSLADCELPTDVALFIAERVQSNIRELEGLLLRLRTYAHVMKLPITLELAKAALADMIPPPPKQMVNVEHIIQLVCDYFEIKREDLLGKSRQKRFVKPRHIAQYLTRKFTNLSLPEIGKKIGGVDHTSVLHACRRITEDMEKDENLRSLISYISRQLTERNQEK